MCQLLVLIRCENELRLHRKALGRVGYLTGVRIQGVVLVCSLPEAKASIRGRQRALGLCGPLLSPDGLSGGSSSLGPDAISDPWALLCSGVPEPGCPHMLDDRADNALGRGSSAFSPPASFRSPSRGQAAPLLKMPVKPALFPPSCAKADVAPEEPEPRTGSHPHLHSSPSGFLRGFVTIIK